MALNYRRFFSGGLVCLRQPAKEAWYEVRWQNELGAKGCAGSFSMSGKGLGLFWKSRRYSVFFVMSTSFSNLLS